MQNPLSYRAHPFVPRLQLKKYARLQQFTLNQTLSNHDYSEQCTLPDNFPLEPSFYTQNNILCTQNVHNYKIDFQKKNMTYRCNSKQFQRSMMENKIQNIETESIEKQDRHSLSYTAPNTHRKYIPLHLKTRDLTENLPISTSQEDILLQVKNVSKPIRNFSSRKPPESKKYVEFTKMYNRINNIQSPNVQSGRNSKIFFAQHTFLASQTQPSTPCKNLTSHFNHHTLQKMLKTFQNKKTLTKNNKPKLKNGQQQKSIFQEFLDQRNKKFPLTIYDQQQSAITLKFNQARNNQIRHQNKHFHV